MDRDDYFQILEETSCYNLENYVTDPEWASLSGLSHMKTDKNDTFHNKDLHKNNEEGKSQKEKNAIKVFE